MSVYCSRCHRCQEYGAKYPSYHRLCFACRRTTGAAYQSGTIPVTIRTFVHRMRCLAELFTPFWLSPCGQCRLPSWGQPCWCCRYYPMGDSAPIESHRRTLDDYRRILDASGDVALAFISDLTNRCVDCSPFVDEAMARASRYRWPDADELYEAFGPGGTPPEMPEVVQRFWYARHDHVQLLRTVEHNPGMLVQNSAFHRSFLRSVDAIRRVCPSLADLVEGLSWEACFEHLDRCWDLYDHPLSNLLAAEGGGREDRLVHADRLCDFGLEEDAQQIRVSLDTKIVQREEE